MTQSTLDWLDKGLGGYSSVQNDGTPLPQRSTLNLLDLLGTDNAGNDSTDLTVVGLLGEPLPSISTGYLNWNGTAWVLTAGTSVDISALTGDVVATGPGVATAEVEGILSHTLPGLSTGYLNWTGSAWAFTNPFASPTLTTPTLSSPTITGETTYTGPSFSVTYSDQYEVATTGATPTTIATIAIPSTCIFRVEFEVEAYSSSAGNPAATWKCSMSYKSVSGTITGLKSALLVSDSDGTNSNAPPSGWAPTVTISGANLLIQVTGAASTNINWSALAQWRVTT
jgi:hypothetical protein